MDTALRRLVRADKPTREKLWAAQKQKWTARTTYALAISPPEAAQRQTDRDPRRMLPLLGELYGVPVRIRGVLPDRKPMRVVIYRISTEGCQVHDAKGKLVASSKPTTRRATSRPANPRPTTHPGSL
jgi:hypothetical protein